MKKKAALAILIFVTAMCFGQTDLEDYFNLCLEFGAPIDVVELYQPFREEAYKAELNGTITYVIEEDISLLHERHYYEYQIWYTIDKDHGLYQSSLIVRAEDSAMQHIFTSYLHKFSLLFGEPVYTHLDDGSLLVFWYNEESFTVKARLILDMENDYKFVSITYCSHLERHADLLTTLYYGTPGEFAPQ